MLLLFTGDFSGYSDVVHWYKARWLGFTIPANFASPYQSKRCNRILEKRWHISLSSGYGIICTYLRRQSQCQLVFPFAGRLFLQAQLQALVSHFIFNGYGRHQWAQAFYYYFFLRALLRKTALQYQQISIYLIPCCWVALAWRQLEFYYLGALHGIALAVHKIWMLLTGKTFKNINGSWWYKILAGLLTFHFVCFAGYF